MGATDMARTSFEAMVPVGDWGALLDLEPIDAFQEDSGKVSTPAMNPKRIEIHYCTQCRWLLRSAWMAQELLSTFDGDIESLTLRPGTGGVFEVRLDGALVWSRKEAGRFPDIVELKQLVRDRIAPGRDLGHIDRKKE
jgi:selenoprotein W-related protein